MNSFISALAITLCLFTTYVNAQTKGKALTVGISPISLSKINPQSDYELIFPSSLVIKKQMNQLSLRTDIGFGIKTREIGFTGPDSYEGTMRISFFSLEFGLEKNILINNLNFYIGAQTSLLFNIIKNQLGGGIDGKGNTSSTIEYWVGLAPYFGWKTAITSRISLGIESKLHSLFNLNPGIPQYFQFGSFVDNSIIITYQI